MKKLDTNEDKDFENFIKKEKINSIIIEDDKLEKALETFLDEYFSTLKYDKFGISQLFLLKDKLKEHKFSLGKIENEASVQFFIKSQIRRGREKEFYEKIQKIFISSEEEESKVHNFMDKFFNELNLSKNIENEWMFYKIKKYIRYKMASKNINTEKEES